MPLSTQALDDISVLGTAAKDRLLARCPVETINALLVTDVEDFTRMLVRMGDLQALALVRSYNALLRESVAAHGGNEIAHLGDGLLAAFGSVRRALECAIDIQRRLVKYAHDAPDAPMRTRIGVHAGEPVADDGRLFGICVNTTFRVCDATAPGSISVSDVVRQLARGHCMQFVDRGNFSLQGLGEELRLHDLLWDSSPQC
jgi:class 3 adenylate cyclase